MPQKYTIEDLQAIAAKRGGKCLSTIYTSTTTHLDWECAEGHQWSAVPKSILKGHWCRQCANKSNGSSQRLTIAAPIKLAKEKDGQLLSSEYKNSTTKLRWRCSKGHEWLSTYSKVRQGQWCPYCSGRRVSETNSLASMFPKVAEEWHPTRNGELSPENITAGSAKSIWWRCGHCRLQWKTSIFNRTGRSSGCPACAKQGASDRVRLSKVKKSGNSVAATLGHIISEWDHKKNLPLKPDTLSARSNRKVWWKCERGHSWQARPGDRFMGTGCPECQFGWQTSRIEVRIFAELSSFFPDLKWRSKVKEVEFDFLIPSIAVAIEVDGHFWHKEKYDKDLAKNVLAREEGLHLLRLRDRRLQKVVDHDLIVELGNHKATVFALCSYLAKYINDSELKRQVFSYAQSRRFKADTIYKDIVTRLPAPSLDESLASLFPSVAKEWDYEKNAPLTPELFKPGSNYRAEWVCSKNPDHRWGTAIQNRTIADSPTCCPMCATILRGKKRRTASIRKHGSIASAAPELTAEWDKDKNGIARPEGYSTQSNDYVWWKCKYGHSWKQQVILRYRKGLGCPVCSKRDRSIVLMTRFAEKFGSIADSSVAENWDYAGNKPLEPRNVSIRYRKSLWWICPQCKKSWRGALKRAEKSNGVCRECETGD